MVVLLLFLANLALIVGIDLAFGLRSSPASNPVSLLLQRLSPSGPTSVLFLTALILAVLVLVHAGWFISRGQTEYLKALERMLKLSLLWPVVVFVLFQLFWNASKLLSNFEMMVDQVAFVSFVCAYVLWAIIFILFGTRQGTDSSGLWALVHVATVLAMWSLMFPGSFLIYISLATK